MIGGEVISSILFLICIIVKFCKITLFNETREMVIKIRARSENRDTKRHNQRS